MTVCGPARDTILTNRQTGKLKLIFLGGRADEQFSLSKNWHDSFGTGKEKLSIFCRTPSI
jgi:hypothetical protein